MAVSPRPNNKATKIAFKIIGVPRNMQSMYAKNTKREKDMRRKFNDTFSDVMTGVRQ